MPQIYEGMFLLDNDLVREGWDQAKAKVTDLIAKHGGSTLTARRWAERKLAYPIKRRTRATYMLCHYELPAEGIPTFVRDLDLSEQVLRYLLLCADDVPAEEQRLHEAEVGSDFVVEAPPSDEVGSYEPLQVPQAESEEETEQEDASSEAAPDASTPAEATPAPAAAEAAPAEAVAVATETEAVTETASSDDTEKGEAS